LKIILHADAAGFLRESEELIEKKKGDSNKKSAPEE
jgi:hypothetical protein